MSSTLTPYSLPSEMWMTFGMLPRRAHGYRFNRTLLMAQIPKFVGITFAALICQSAMAEDLVRLLAAEKGDHLSFFLPITHVGTSVEDGGAYLDDVIRIAFRQSTALYDESSLSVGPISWLNDCPKEFVDGELDERLDKAFHEAVQGSAFWNANTLFKKKVSRFTKMHHIVLSLGGQPPLDSTEPIIFRRPAQRLLHAEHHIPYESIETTDEIFTAYCDVDVEERHAFVRSLVSEGNSERARGQTTTPKQYLDDAATLYVGYLNLAMAELRGQKDIGQAVPESEFDIRLGGVYIWPRNQLWIKRINQLAKTTAIPFYALGAAHFPTLESRKGLITLLREEGYSLTLITDRNELNKILRRHQKYNAIPDSDQKMRKPR